MTNNNNPQVLTTEAGQQILDQFLGENNIPCTADCIIEELNTDTCNLGLFNASSISIVCVDYVTWQGVEFIDENNNRLLVRMSRFGEDELCSWRRYASEEQFQSGAQFRINRERMEVSGGEEVVWQIGLNIALMVEFGTNGVNDEYRLALEQAEELEREMNDE
jgi:prolyl oligopeptidase PreP (S9A serine peptidase family)